MRLKPLGLVVARVNIRLNGTRPGIAHEPNQKLVVALRREPIEPPARLVLLNRSERLEHRVHDTMLDAIVF